MRTAKILAMGILAAAAWIADWVLIKQAIYQNQPLTFLPYPLAATILGITFLTFFFLINRNRIVSVILDVIIVGGYIAIMPKDFYVMLGAAIFLIFLIVSEQRLLADRKSQIDFSLRRTMGGALTLTVYAIVLLTGFNIYYNTQTDFKANPNFYYERIAKAANKTVPYVTDEFEGLSNEQKQALSQQLANEAVEKIKETAEGYQKYFPFIFAIIVTALLLTFSFLFRWTTMIVSWLIFRLLLMTRFFKITPEMVEVQKLDI